MKKYKVVCSMNDANTMLEKGYSIRKIDRDKFDRTKLIFLFEYSEQLIKDLESITKRR